MLDLKDITKEYKMGTNVLRVLRGVSLTIERGDFVAIMGPSGSGKSTLMHILGLLDVPTSGSYKIDGREVSKLNDNELAILRREEIGFIFQQFNLLPRQTAVENVAVPLLYTNHKPPEALVPGLLKKVGLESRMTHTPSELSGGQQQRVAIARSLVNGPRIILADEPTGNLDSVSEREIMGILQELNKQGITVIIVTHEEEIGATAKRRIRLRDGLVVADERLHPLEKHVNTREAELPQEEPARFWLATIYQYLQQGLKTLAANKVRTSLSMLGILIGVAAVVAMLALGRGAQTAIETQLASLGSNLLLLRPGAIRVGGVAQETGSTTRITVEDVGAIKEQIAGVKEASPTVQGRGQVTYMNKNWSTQVMGVGTAYAEMHAANPEIGRFFTEDENQMRARVAVIGLTLVRELFGSQNPIGEMIKINRVNFQVIGVLPPKGATGWRDQDDLVVIPIQTAMRRLLGKDYVDSVDVEVANASDMSRVQTQLSDLMLSRHRVPVSQSKDAFDVRNMADIQNALTQSSKTMSTLLASIAAISLLVGGIGIMNIMLVSVKERTREIGLRKAVGATGTDILSQFLAESLVVSVVGGTFGIVLGWVITKLLATFAGWPTSVSPTAVALAFFFSAGIGIVFGAYPAKTAADLHPIDALRYE